MGGSPAWPSSRDSIISKNVPNGRDRCKQLASAPREKGMQATTALIRPTAARKEQWKTNTYIVGVMFKTWSGNEAAGVLLPLVDAISTGGAMGGRRTVETPAKLAGSVYGSWVTGSRETPGEKNVRTTKRSGSSSGTRVSSNSWNAAHANTHARKSGERESYKDTHRETRGYQCASCSPALELHS